jgi:lipoprotein-anchoring transpeptidase ErfK/SrfK
MGVEYKELWGVTVNMPGGISWLCQLSRPEILQSDGAQGPQMMKHVRNLGHLGLLLSLLVLGLPQNTQAKELVALESGKYPMGSIVVDTSERRLYYSLGNGQALKYKVAVGKPRHQWFGKTFVEKKKKDPGWYPTRRMRRGGAPSYVAPGPRNPLGTRAIYLGWSEYRIHGTNAPSSIGRAASSGCIRMLNKDVADLFERVHIGAPVFVIR